MVWEVEVRPLRGWSGLVKPFTAAIVSTIARNLQARLAEPGARVELAGPRGSGPPLGSVAKDSWLGGVLAAHLADRRDVMEQTRAMLQPWTWGRSEDGPDDFEEWTMGSLPE